jgi:hypothetical protein
MPVDELSPPGRPAIGMLDERSGGVDERLAGFDRRFDAIDKRLDSIDDRVSREAESTRRHSGMLLEQLKNYIKLLARRNRI